jgi:hypothetical protein
MKYYYYIKKRRLPLVTSKNGGWAPTIGISNSAVQTRHKGTGIYSPDGGHQSHIPSSLAVLTLPGLVILSHYGLLVSTVGSYFVPCFRAYMYI